ncbi:hypothetical protein [Thermococcus sp. 21S7]|uniref:hypothetical protein n=1 Tax=Thermococcus sp. 21S7 TaxID=1638221 RepID=UPI001438F36B|nr:hypothetical protein [Thermococcus sp. 21S7]NJE60476.1 hypothetical protein [Thermococcus sp. 21S7]
MKKFLALVVIGVVLAAGCLDTNTKTHTYKFELPHAEEVIIVDDFKFQQEPTLQLVVDFKTFQEHAKGKVYVTSDVVNIGGFISPKLRPEITFYTISNDGTLWISRVILSEIPRIESIHVNGTTVIVEGS